MQSLRNARYDWPICTKRNSTGFTLVEVLIVIVIMAVLASLIIPLLGNEVSDAQASAMDANLAMLRSAIERYKLDHDGNLPKLVGGSLPQLVATTDVEGNIGQGALFPFGPYVDSIPKNPVNGVHLVRLSNTNPPANLANQSGWVYHPGSGRLWAGKKRQRRRRVCP